MKRDGDKIIMTDKDLRENHEINEITVKSSSGEKTLSEFLGLKDCVVRATLNARDYRKLIFSCILGSLGEAVGDLEVAVDDLRGLGFQDLAERIAEAHKIADEVYDKVEAIQKEKSPEA